MANYLKLCKIFLLYGLTAPTNVMCLGAFTEFWLQDAGLSRLDFSNSYLLATISVFLILQIQKYFKQTIQLKLCFNLLAILFITFGWYCFSSLVNLFFFFFFAQWLGQGLIVEECRVLLANTAKRYSLAAGCLEAWGTLLVYTIPFIFLYILKIQPWQNLIISLGIIYALIACCLKKTASSFIINKTSTKVWRNKQFLLANSIIYLPIVLTSGFFFHLEAFAEHYQLSLKTLEFCILPQVLASIFFQVIFGFFVKDEQKRWVRMFYLLLISQILWLSSLLFIRGSIFCWVYTLSGAIGWGCFGLLVNITWRYLFKKDTIFVEACLRNSVSFGFLANAAGPLLFTLFLP